MRRYERISTPPRWSSESDWLAELAMTKVGTSTETRAGSVWGDGSSHPAWAPASSPTIAVMAHWMTLNHSSPIAPRLGWSGGLGSG